MRRIITVAVTTAALLLPGASAHAIQDRNPHASFDNPLHDACRFQYRDGKAGWTVKETQLTITCATRRWPVSRDTAFAIADRESNFWHLAKNRYSSASGVYQFVSGTWANVRPMYPRMAKVLGPSVFNGRSNVMYAIRYAHERGWGPWGG